MLKPKVYEKKDSAQPLITAISTGCKSPLLQVKFCNIMNPFYYPNSPKIPRYSITCVVDPEEHGEFLEAIETIEKNEKVVTIIKEDSEKIDGKNVKTGKKLIKFQTKDLIPVFDSENNPMELKDDLERGESVYVVYDIMRYTKKGTLKVEHGINFKPSGVYYVDAKPAVKKTKKKAG